MPTVPTTVFSGFLGSGKTTIIGHLIDQIQDADSQVVYIKNEIGDENVDGQILEGKHIRTRQLLNGCICCTLVGPFISAASEIVERLNPKRIIIEASGAADPAAIALMIDTHPLLERDGVIAIIDVVNFEGYADLSETARNQTKFTDLLVFNKVEQVDIERKRAVVDMVRELNRHAPIVEAPGAILDKRVIFGASSIQLDELLSEAGFTQSAGEHEQAHSDHSSLPHHDHLSSDGLESFSHTPSQPVLKETLANWLQTLPNNVYRVKGFVETESGWLLINKVGVRVQLTPAEQPAGERLEHGTIVCIGFRIKAQEKDILSALITEQPTAQ